MGARQIYEKGEPVFGKDLLQQRVGARGLNPPGAIAL
jgi:hypothetical protein